MAFDSATAKAGSGGLNFAVDSFTDTESVGRAVTYPGVTYGAMGGPYTVVTTSNGFPVAPATGAAWVLGAGSAAIGSVTVTGSVAVTGTFWQATQPVSAASLPLPSGASTAAKQPAL